jgi:DNA-binding IclR family transcriptional regulator
MPTAVPAARRRGRPGHRQPQPIQSLAKALAIVDHLAHAEEPIGVTEVARGIGIPKATAHRLLATLHGADAVAYDPSSQRYSLGPSIVRYGLLGLRRMELHRVARPQLERMQQETGETAVLAGRQGSTKVFLDQVESGHDLRQTVVLGERRHLFHGSAGLAMLAFLDSDEREKYLAGGPFPRISDSTITDPKQLRVELDTTRQRGFALTRGERSTSMAAPVFGHTQVVVGAMMICGPSFRFSADKITRFSKAVRRAGDEVSTALGYSSVPA